MDEQTRLLTLAHLKNGKKPAEAAELTGVTYALALKLRRELQEAEKRNKVIDLFKLNKAALEILLESVRKQLTPAIEAFGIGELVEQEIDDLTSSIDGGKLLNQEFQASAKILANRITTIALTINNADTILALAKALCELQRAFFGQDTNASAHLPATSFEQHLRN